MEIYTYAEDGEYYLMVVIDGSFITTYIMYSEYLWLRGRGKEISIGQKSDILYALDNPALTTAQVIPRDAFDQPIKCPYCGPDGTVYDAGLPVKACDNCRGTGYLCYDKSKALIPEVIPPRYKAPEDAEYGIVVFYNVWRKPYTHNQKELREVGRTHVMPIFEAYEKYANTPNPASQLLRFTTDEERALAEAQLARDIVDPEWLDELFNAM